MKTHYVIIIFLFVVISTACGNKPLNNQVNSDSEEVWVEVNVTGMADANIVMVEVLFNVQFATAMALSY